MKGSRVQAVIRELRGEKIDIVQYNEDISQYVRNALNPAMINRASVLEYETRSMEVIVSEDQLSLAIGKRGQNVRLASKLVGWNLDIMSEVEKKAEVEMEMERLAQANAELSSLPEVDEEVSNRLLDAGFRAVEEVALASLDELTSIDGIDEDLAIDIHDAAETLLQEWQAQAEQEEAEAAEAAEEAGEADPVEEEEAEAGEELAAVSDDSDDSEEKKTEVAGDVEPEPAGEEPERDDETDRGEEV
jgi:N utilization substance protein A